MTFETKAEDRYFEDYRPGAVHEFGSVTITEPEIIEFAAAFRSTTISHGRGSGETVLLRRPDRQRLAHCKRVDADSR